MTTSLKIVLAIFTISALQSCASLEITQSRYGNGIGVSFNKLNKAEQAKADAFRTRKKAELNDKKHVLVPKNKPFSIVSNPIPEDISKPIKNTQNRALLQQKQDNSFQIDAAANQKNASRDKKITLNNTMADVRNGTELFKPSKTEKTQGDTTNLGYLGVVLIIAGLVFILLGIGAGFGVLGLGVLLVIIAYFLG